MFDSGRGSLVGAGVLGGEVAGGDTRSWSLVSASSAWVMNVTKKAGALQSRVRSVIQARKGVLWGLLAIAVMALHIYVRRRMVLGTRASTSTRLMNTMTRILKGLSDLVFGSI